MAKKKQPQNQPLPPGMVCGGEVFLTTEEKMADLLSDEVVDGNVLVHVAGEKESKLVPVTLCEAQRTDDIPCATEDEEQEPPTSEEGQEILHPEATADRLLLEERQVKKLTMPHHVDPPATGLVAKLKGKLKREEDDSPHLIVEARAGCGKTTTLIEGLKLVMGGTTALTPSEQQDAVWCEMMKSRGKAKSACFLAFNKSIADELERRVPRGVVAMTCHKMGFKAVSEAFSFKGGERCVNKYRVDNIIEEVMGTPIGELRRTHAAVVGSVKRLVDLVKCNLVPLDIECYEDEQVVQSLLEELADYYTIPLETEWGTSIRAEVMDLVPKVIDRCKNVAKDGCIDFADMIWLPVILGLNVTQYDILLVDEAQDLNRCQQALVRKAGRRLILCGDPEQCQPAGTMVRITGKDQPVPIETLKVGDCVVSYNSNTSMFVGMKTQGRKVEEIAHRQYDGDLYHVNGSSSTPNHRWLTRFRDDIPEEYTAVYLVELPDQTYRLGMTQLVMGVGGFGPGMRARQRGAEKLWLLHVYKTRDEARRAEFKDSLTYRVPQKAYYESMEDDWCRELMEEGVTSDVEALLTSYGQIYEYPIWKKGDNQHVGKYSYVTEACNLIPDVNEMCVWKDGTRTPQWEPIKLHVEPDWSGLVYSLKVQPTERGRRLYVSDNVVTHNSVYGFAGADCESIERMTTDLMKTKRGCVTLPLTYTRRCPKAVVREANKVVEDFHAFPDAQEGAVTYARYGVQGEPFSQTSYYFGMVRPGDMVICRVNAPLVRECFRFIRAGRRANIQGRDIGEGIANQIRSFGEATIPGLLQAVDAWLSKEVAKENARKNPSEDKIINLQDKADCIVTLTEGCNDVADVVTRVTALFSDDNLDNTIRLASIHKAKGLEARRVFFLQPERAKCPHPMAESEWQRKQELNLWYIAVTRAMEELIHVS